MEKKKNTRPHESDTDSLEHYLGIEQDVKNIGHVWPLEKNTHTHESDTGSLEHYLGIQHVKNIGHVWPLYLTSLRGCASYVLVSWAISCLKQNYSYPQRIVKT